MKTRRRLPKIGMSKGYLFFNKRYIKGVPYERVYERVRGWTFGRSLPV